MKDRVIVKFYDKENDEKFSLYYGDKELRWADFMCRIGAMCPYPGVGYVFERSKLEDACKKYNGDPYWKDAVGIPVTPGRPKRLAVEGLEQGTE